jgi:hypothetical protein
MRKLHQLKVSRLAASNTPGNDQVGRLDDWLNPNPHCFITLTNVTALKGRAQKIHNCEWPAKQEKKLRNNHPPAYLPGSL